MGIAAFKWRKGQSVSQSVIEKLMYAYIQDIRLQGLPPISHFTLLEPEKLYFNGF